MNRIPRHEALAISRTILAEAVRERLPGTSINEANTDDEFRLLRHLAEKYGYHLHTSDPEPKDDDA